MGFLTDCENCGKQISNSAERGAANGEPCGLAARYIDYQTVCNTCRQDTKAYGPGVKDFRKHIKTNRKCRVCGVILNQTRYFFCDEHKPNVEEVDDFYIETKREKLGYKA